MYVQLGTEGLASYHFKKHNSYISYAALPQMWRLVDETRQKLFLNESYDPETRTFIGNVVWSPEPVNGDSKWEHRMVFSEDLLEIESGEVIRYDANGSKREDSEKSIYGQHLFYEKLIGRYEL